MVEAKKEAVRLHSLLLFVRTCQAAGIPLADCVKMITQTPARIMGLPRKGRIEVGFDADIVIFDSDIEIKKVFLLGEQVV